MHVFLSNHKSYFRFKVNKLCHIHQHLIKFFLLFAYWIEVYASLKPIHNNKLTCSALILVLLKYSINEMSKPQNRIIIHKNTGDNSLLFFDYLCIVYFVWCILFVILLITLLFCYFIFICHSPTSTIMQLAFHICVYSAKICKLKMNWYLVSVNILIDFQLNYQILLISSLHTFDENKLNGH